MNLAFTEPTIHASAVAIGEAGVLIRGPSRSGKSALARALIAADPDRHCLIADDRVAIQVRNGALVAFAPATIAGLVEIRGAGIFAVPYRSPVTIMLVVDIADAPETDSGFAELAGIPVRHLAHAAGLHDPVRRIVEEVQRIPDFGGFETVEKPLALRNRSGDIGRPAGAGAVIRIPGITGD